MNVFTVLLLIAVLVDMVIGLWDIKCTNRETDELEKVRRELRND